jgi:hypothetical protein
MKRARMANQAATSSIISKSTMDATLPERAKKVLENLFKYNIPATGTDAIKVSNYVYRGQTGREYTYSELLSIRELVVKLELEVLKAEVARASQGEFSKMKTFQ